MSQQKEIGTLVVVVLKAQHLHQPSFYKQNPYAQASLSGLTKRTKVDPKGGQHPVWDDELRFPVLADVGKDKVNRTLAISCYKDEQRSDDILLGKGTVSIEETLKTGEFDDWVPLETSAGARGQVYLEMTFYANSPPSLTRRPSKLSPSDRLARPAAYYTQSRQSTPKSTSPIPPPQPGGSPAAGERKPSQSLSTGGNQIPSSLIPAHGPKSQASRQTPPNGGATSAVAAKRRSDSLPPLPDDNDPSEVVSGKNPGLPATLHPGGRGGPRSMPPQNRNQVISTGRPPPEMRPDQLQRRTLSDIPALHAAAPLPFSHLQTPSYSPEVTSTIRARVGSTPSIFVEEHVENHPLLAFPTPLNSSSGPAQEHEPRGVYPPGDYDSFTYGPPGPVYVQPDSPAYIPVPAQGYPRSFSPSQRATPVQSSHTPPGQPQQLYDALPPSHHQQYTQYPSGPPTSLPLSPPQTYSQLQSTQQQQQQQPLYPPQPQQHPHQQSYLSPQQQQYLPPPQQQNQQQQYHPQHLPYAQTPHPPQVPQLYQQHQHPGLPPSSPSLIAPPQQPPLYSSVTPQPQQPYFAVPPPPPSVQSQTPQPYAPQLPHQPQSYFSPPPPPPPPPPPSLYSQGGKGPSIPVSVAQPSQTPVQRPAPSQGAIPPPPSLPQRVTPLTPLPLPPTTTLLPSQVVPNTAPAPSTEDVVRQRQVEGGRNETEHVAVAEAGTVLREEIMGTPEDVTKNQTSEEQSKKVVEEKPGQLEQLNDTKEQGVREEEEYRQRIEEEDRQRREEELRKQEALKEEEEHLRQQEVERRRREEEERKKQEEEEQRKRKEEEHRRREEEERRRRDEEERRVREEEEHRRRKEEERRRRDEEERRVREEEGRRKREEEERRRMEEEERRRQEEERARREEEEEEEEHRKQEEERIQREREEEERRREEAEEQARRRRAEEAEAERSWQEELARIKARAEQEAADAAFARAQTEAEEVERRRQEEVDLALVRQVQEEAEREEILARERRRQEETDMEVARREQAHEEELERRRREERWRKMEETDRELARRLDMELNLGAESSSNGRDQSQQRAAGSGGQ